MKKQSKKNKWTKTPMWKINLIFVIIAIFLVPIITIILQSFLDPGQIYQDGSFQCNSDVRMYPCSLNEFVENFLVWSFILVLALSIPSVIIGISLGPLFAFWKKNKKVFPIQKDSDKLIFIAKQIMLFILGIFIIYIMVFSY